jgi:hypothetical protein
MYAVLFFSAISGALWAVWWRIEGKVDRAKEEALRRAEAAQQRADTIAMDLAAHRLHSAEVFATKQGMQEQTAQLLRAIEGVGNRIDGMNERLDRAFEHPHVPPTPRRRATT